MIREDGVSDTAAADSVSAKPGLARIRSSGLCDLVDRVMSSHSEWRGENCAERNWPRLPVCLMQSSIVGNSLIVSLSSLGSAF